MISILCAITLSAAAHAGFHRAEPLTVWTFSGAVDTELDSAVPMPARALLAGETQWHAALPDEGGEVFTDAEMCEVAKYGLDGRRHRPGVTC